MNVSYSVFIAALTGAVLQEAVYWYGQREDLIISNRGNTNALENKNDEKSNWKLYWLITGVMIIGSSFGTYFWVYDRLDTVNLKDVLVTGAAFPTLLKIAVQSFKKPNKPITRLGSKSAFDI